MHNLKSLYRPYSCSGHSLKERITMNDSAQYYNAIQEFLQGRGVPYLSAKGQPACYWRMSAPIPPGYVLCEVRCDPIKIGGSTCQIRAIYPYRFDPGDSALVLELTRMINEENCRWSIGHFTLDLEEGELAYTKTFSCYGALLDEAMILTHLKQVRRRVDALQGVCRRILAQPERIEDPLLEELRDLTILEFSRADKVLVPEKDPAVMEIVKKALSTMQITYQECEDPCRLRFSQPGFVQMSYPKSDTYSENDYAFHLKSLGFDLNAALPAALRVDLADERMVSETLAFISTNNLMSPCLHPGYYAMDPQSGRIYYSQTVEVSATVLQEDTALFIEDMNHDPIIDRSKSILYEPIVIAQMNIAYDLMSFIRIIRNGASASEVLY